MKNSMDERQMISTIQIYIHHRKNVEVNITPILPQELPLLLIAYNVASNWLKQNLVKTDNG